MNFLVFKSAVEEAMKTAAFAPAPKKGMTWEDRARANRAKKMLPVDANNNVIKQTSYRPLRPSFQTKEAGFRLRYKDDNWKRAEEFLRFCNIGLIGRDRA